MLQNEALHHGLATESLAESLLNDSRLNADRDYADVLEVPATESDRRMLASILLKEDEELTAEVLEASVRALRRIHLRRRQEDVQRELKKPGLAADKERLRELLTELERISRALRDPGLAEGSLAEDGSKAGEQKKQRETKSRWKPSKYLRELQIAAGMGEIGRGQLLDGTALMC